MVRHGPPRTGAPRAPARSWEDPSASGSGCRCLSAPLLSVGYLGISPRAALASIFSEVYGVLSWGQDTWCGGTALLIHPQRSCHDFRTLCSLLGPRSSLPVRGGDPGLKTSLASCGVAVTPVCLDRSWRRAPSTDPHPPPPPQACLPKSIVSDFEASWKVWEGSWGGRRGWKLPTCPHCLLSAFKGPTRVKAPPASAVPPGLEPTGRHPPDPKSGPCSARPSCGEGLRP